MRRAVTTCSCSSLLAAALFVSLPAGGAEPAPLSHVMRPRLALGPAVGVLDQSNLSIDGRRQADELGGLTLAQALSYSQGLLPYFGLIAFGRFGTEETVWSANRGESRTNMDFGVGPELWLLPKAHGAFVDVRFAVPFGPSLAWFHPSSNPHGARDQYSTGNGWNLDVIGGMDVIWGHHGVGADLVYMRRWTALTHRATLESDPSVRSSERYRYEQGGVSFGVNYVYRF